MAVRRGGSSRSAGSVPVSGSQCLCKFQRELIMLTERKRVGADRTGDMKPFGDNLQGLS